MNYPVYVQHIKTMVSMISEASTTVNERTRLNSIMRVPKKEITVKSA